MNLKRNIIILIVRLLQNKPTVFSETVSETY